MHPRGIIDPACPLADHPLNDGLVADYSVLPLSGWRGGKTLRDVVRGKRSPHDGTLTNGPTWAGPRGRPGGYGAVNFDGANDLVTTGANLLQDAAGTASRGLQNTISCWFKLGAAGTRILWTQNQNNAIGLLTLTGLWTAQHAGGITGTTSWTWTQDTAAWHHLSLVMPDGWTGTADFLLYLDGAALAQTTASGAANPNAAGFILGGRAQATTGWSGLIDGPRIYNRALPAGSIRALSDQQRAGSPDLYRWVRSVVYFTPPAAGGGASTGTLAVTLADVTLAGAGAVAITGAEASTLGTLTSMAAGALTLTGTAADTLGDATLTGSGAVALAGAVGVTLGPLTAVGAGANAIAGVTGGQLDPVTLAATGGIGAVGSLAGTLGDAALSATGAVTLSGAGSVTLGDATLAGAGSIALTGTVAAALAAMTVAAVGTLTDPGAVVRPAFRYAWRGSLARVLAWRGGVSRRRL